LSASFATIPSGSATTRSNSIGHGLRALVLGQDPFQIEPLWRRLSEGTRYLGDGGVRLAAISAVEMALWDIAGKVAGRPVCELLGGAFRPRVRAYARVLFPEDPIDLTTVRTTAERLRQQGYTAMKFGWGGFGADRRADVAVVHADVPSHWAVTFSVDDTGTIANRAEKLGGRLIVPSSDVPCARIAVVTDPQGAIFTISKYSPPT
jgi:L-alanine-DL-glutamate epimerase-like enolase superfamily enzyme